MKYDKQVEVDGESYTITMFTPTKALAVLTKLTKMVGQPLSQAAGGLNGNVEDVMPKVMEALGEKLDEKSVETLIKTDLMSAVLYGNQPVLGIFDMHFQGKIGTVFKLCYEVVRFNFDDFLGGLADAMGRVTAKGSSARKQSAGRSGG